eukprot:Skav234375  [mRNA]  locus=scaffold2071:145019:146682:+ [translate_table: standard]
MCSIFKRSALTVKKLLRAKSNTSFTELLPTKAATAAMNQANPAGPYSVKSTKASILARYATIAKKSCAQYHILFSKRLFRRGRQASTHK